MVIPCVFPPNPAEIGGRICPSPADFSVTEILPFGPDGSGPHLWLEVEKVGRNSEEVARLLARHGGVAARDVGYAGLKDRHATTRQVFTLPQAPGLESQWQDWSVSGVNLLAMHRHGRKLRRGALLGNRFRLRVQNVRGDEALWQAALSTWQTQGFPNYFGPQRFGRDNLAAAGRLLLGKRQGRMPHHLRALFWSTARSALFNLILAQRVRTDSWSALLPGEVVQLAGSHSVFLADPADEDLVTRLAAWDLHPTGPLAGRGGLVPQGAALALETEVLATWPGLTESPGNGLAWAAALAEQGLDAARRALRCRADALQTVRLADDQQILEFTLPAGAYASVAMAALGLVWEASSSGEAE